MSSDLNNKLGSVLRGRVQRAASRITRGKALVAAATTALALGVAAAPASATSVAYWPSFECFDHANGTATLVVDKLLVNSDSYWTSWDAEVFRWNGRSYVPYIRTIKESFPDSPIGDLADIDLTYRVPHGYYRVLYAYASNDGRGPAVVWAHPFENAYSRVACHI
jgi:hypothetical protein